MSIEPKKKKINLSVEIAGIQFQNPVLTASGTFGYGMEYTDFIDLNLLGGIVVKGLSIKPSHGNSPPRMVETASGMLNAIGLQNIGVEVFINEKLPLLKKFNANIIVNFFGDTQDEYVLAAERLNDITEIAALEMNISCPNVEKGGMTFGTEPKITEELVRKVRKVTSSPLIVKLSPNVTDIVVMAKAAVNGGADALSIINTLLGMAIDIKTRCPMLANVTGGLSGPAIKPVALRMVWQVAKAVDIPIIGIGGIMNAQDALEFIIAGATAVQVGTANFIDPSISVKIIEGIKNYCQKDKIGDIKDLIGTLRS
ncbi:MAG: dihydroorotate dehydrogenase [Nitrospinota bacterium]|jgi:dihydroorotate dehydrogenase (NAD+) catalytic subunit|nr:dihydroorotate dehydrogenase [Nitrospinota bacterium]MDP7580000.1 dihydroorotate dehydrogenase [Nitrospinota bacterium]HJN02920.1 dihydroorotate dehydrogenase [Nitrospinota bacterium]